MTGDPLAKAYAELGALHARCAELADALAETTAELGRARAVLARRDLGPAEGPGGEAPLPQATKAEALGTLMPDVPCLEEHTPPTAARPHSDRVQQEAGGAAATACAVSPSGGVPCCKVCGKPRLEWQVFCGAACSERWEAGERCWRERERDAGDRDGREVWLVYDSDDAGGVWETDEACARAMTCPGESYAGGKVVRAVIQRGEP